MAIVRERERQRALLECEPTLEQVIKAIDIPASIIDEIQAIASETFEFNRPIKSNTLVELALRLTQGCHHESPPEILINDSQISAEEELDSRLNSEAIEQVLSTLTPREALVIKLRFGLADDTEYTLAEIGRQLGMSRERVRQIEKEALDRLQHHTRKKYMEELLV